MCDLSTDKRMFGCLTITLLFATLQLLPYFAVTLLFVTLQLLPYFAITLLLVTLQLLPYSDLFKLVCAFFSKDISMSQRNLLFITLRLLR